MAERARRSLSDGDALGLGQIAVHIPAQRAGPGVALSAVTRVDACDRCRDRRRRCGGGDGLAAAQGELRAGQAPVELFVQLAIFAGDGVALDVDEDMLCIAAAGEGDIFGIDGDLRRRKPSRYRICRGSCCCRRW